MGRRRLDLRIEEDARGLPVVWFNGFEGRFDLLSNGAVGDGGAREISQRCCRVVSGAGGALDFVIEAPAAWVRVQHGWRMWLSVLAMLLGPLVLPFLLLAGLWESSGYFGWALLDGAVVYLGAFVLPVERVGWRLEMPWNELESFVVETERDGAKYVHAYFSTMGPPLGVVAVDRRVPHAEVSQLRFILNREFIERRARYCEKAGTAGPVSGDVLRSSPSVRL